MPQGVSSQTRRRSELGRAALVFGLVAVAFAFTPIVGEFIAVPSASLAVVTGAVALVRTEQGPAVNRGIALAGVVLGLVAGLITFLVVAATVGPGG